MSWEDHWREGNTPWDAAASPPILHKLVATGLRGRRALVPGCGAGYDVFTLASAGFEVVGLDVAPSAAPRFAKLRARAGLRQDQARLVTEDFFEFSPPEPFDLIWDYTFLCALDPERRPDWKDKQLSLLHRGGELCTLLFPVDPAAPRNVGPPYPLDPESVRHLLAPELVPITLERVRRSHPGRTGKEWLGRWRHAA